MTKRTFLDGAYDLTGAQNTQAFYQDWAETYDTEVQQNGYVTPGRCAIALAVAADDLGAPVLDIGCGTGLSGLALRKAGFTTIDGIDLTEEMLVRARSYDGLYRDLRAGDVMEEGLIAPGQYANMAAIGVLSPGHAPAELIDTVLGALESGGCFTFSLNDHALADPSFEGRIRENVDAGWAQLVSKNHGEHLPGIDLSSTVYVLRRN